MSYDPDSMYGTVLRRQLLTPNLVRIVFGGPGLAKWRPSDSTDAYLVLWFPPADAPYSVPFDVEQVQAEHPVEWWPSHRHYSVRHFEASRNELTIDFVVHGDSGVAGPWARAAQPGDRVMLTLPGGGYRPNPDADWHLMVGDESALPAIAASLEVLPDSARAIAVLLCDGPGHELDLHSSARLEVTWCYRRGEAQDSALLVDAVRALDWPHGRVHGFVHGEAGEIREVRRHLLAERGFAREDLSISGYWRRTMTDEAWRKVKRAWNAEVESDVLDPISS